MFHEACFLGGYVIIHLLDEAKIQMFVSNVILFSQGLTFTHPPMHSLTIKRDLSGICVYHLYDKIQI